MTGNSVVKVLLIVLAIIGVVALIALLAMWLMMAGMMGNGMTMMDGGMMNCCRGMNWVLGTLVLVGLIAAISLFFRRK